MANDQTKSNLIEEEILVRDEEGNFKILRGGELVSLEMDEKKDVSALARLGLKEIVEEVMRESGFRFADEILNKRLADAILARLKDVRDGKETTDLLMRSTKTGGLGQSREQAEKIIELIDEKLKKDEVILAIKMDSEREIVGQKREAPKPALPPKPVVDLNIIFEKISNEAIRKIELKIKDDLRNRFKSVIISRLKDVRDELETEEVLMKPINLGGLGLTLDETGEVITLLRTYNLTALEKAEEKRLATEIEKKMAPIAPKPILSPKEEIKKEVVPAPKIAGETKSEEKIAPKIEPQRILVKPSFLPVVEQKMDIMLSVKEKIGAMPKPEPKKIETSLKQPVMKPPVPVPPKEKILSEKEQAKIPAEKKEKEASIAPKINLSPAAPPAISSRPAGSRQKVTDVKFVPRLVGPVEELKQMSLADWRRLAPNIEGIINKILSKLDLLEDESFGKRIAGIKAWQESEVYKLYLDMGRDSVKNVRTIAEIINERKSEGRPVLSEEEFKAVMDLNRLLRF